jgi:2-polyprenyl-3-methyl-5-hydroxy-6-metoxy-1,4-benzoquinol methylase
VSARRIGTSALGEPLHCLTVDGGEPAGDRDAVMFGLPHPNEPIGGLTTLHLARRLAEDPTLRARPAHTWHLVPYIDPDGLRLNEGWLAGPFTREHYARHFCEEQVEWTFPLDHGAAYFDAGVVHTPPVSGRAPPSGTVLGMDTLPLTGERTVPGIPEENYWFRRHEAVYAALAPRCAGRRVLEAGCGEGYGAALLTAAGARVLALDHDAPTAAHVARRYPRVGIARANLVALPVASGALDAVVSLQVIEHLWDQEGFLRECRRVLRPDGELAVSTPNRLTFSPGRDTPLNPFHTRELAPTELADLVRDGGFTEVELLGLHHGPRLRDLDARHGGLVDAQVRIAVSGTPWPADLRGDVAAVETADFLLTPVDLDASLDLLVTARA